MNDIANISKDMIALMFQFHQLVISIRSFICEVKSYLILDDDDGLFRQCLYLSISLHLQCLSSPFSKVLTEGASTTC